MPLAAEPSHPEPDRLEAEADRAIAACGGVKALIVANEFLEVQVTELQAAVSNGYVRLPRDRKGWYD